MNLFRRVVPVLTLCTGIVGIFAGFALFLYPVDMRLPGYALTLPAVAGGVGLWWLGCRMSSGSPQPRRHDPAVGKEIEQGGEVGLPDVIMLAPEYVDQAEPLCEGFS